MIITREEKEILNHLSEQAFGSRSKWSKLMRDGESVPITELVERQVPGPNGDIETKTVRVYKRAENGALLHEIRRHTVESVSNLMAGLIQQRQVIQKLQQDRIAQQKLKQEQAAELENSLNLATGSAL